MTAADFISELKSMAIDEIMPVLQEKIDELYIARIQCATLTSEEAARYLGITKECLYKLVREKQISAIHIGSLYSRKPNMKFRLSSLDKWLIEQEASYHERWKE